MNWESRQRQQQKFHQVILGSSQRRMNASEVTVCRKTWRRRVVDMESGIGKYWLVTPHCFSTGTNRCLMSASLLLSSLLVGFTSNSFVKASSDVVSTESSSSSSQPLYCVLEGHSPKTHEPLLIPNEWIDDDYCDCPFTGADEPNTSACSGAPLGLWAGITSDVDTLQEFYQPITDFTCPQQPTKKLSHSKLHDGQCDCCDGADEHPGTCVDQCDEILAAEREAQQQRQESFNIGYQIRQQRLDDYKQKRAMVEQEILDIETTKIPPLEESIKLLEENISLAHEQSKLARQQMLSTLITSVESPLLFLSTLSNDELVELIVSMCHLEGESHYLFEERRKNNRDLHKQQMDVELDCITLLKVLQEEHNIECDMISNDMANCSTKKNADDGTNVAETTKKFNNKNNRRAKFYHNDDKLRNDPYDKLASRLISPLRISFYNHAQEILKRIHDLYQELEQQQEDEEDVAVGGDKDDHHDRDRPSRDLYDEDEYHNHMYEDDYNMGGEDHYYGIDDDDIRDDEEEDESPRRRLTTVHPPPRAPAREQEREKSKKEHHKETPNSDGTVTTEETYDASSASPTVSKPLVDPLVLNLVKDQLSLRLRNIQRGGRYAQHGRAIMEAVVELLEEEETENESVVATKLRTLVVSIIEQSRIHDADLTEALYMLVHPNVGTNILRTLEESDGICGEDPGLPLCPPLPPIERTISMSSSTKNSDGSKILVPPEALIESLEERCKERFEGIEVYVPGTCAATEIANIPPDAPNGFHGYFDITLRSSDDTKSLLSRTFASSSSTTNNDNNDIAQKEKELSELNNELNQLRKDLKSKREDIGIAESGDDNASNKYGPDGILHSWKDKCLSVQAGKYTYEMCPFGKATQKEGRGGGTSLGTYQSIQFDTNTYTYYLHFSKGQKCWNGPQRSAKVYLTCGKTDELLSAEEPETCVYHIHGTSPLMCDIHYAKRHNLTVPSL